jgi:hypothetical protein
MAVIKTDALIPQKRIGGFVCTRGHGEIEGITRF